MTRWKAAAIHLLISIVVAVSALAGMLLTLYPWQYFFAGGGDRLLTILISVDVIIGPLLTLIVFKAGKPSLKFDLSVIALLQVAALLYGLFVIAQARPVFLVHVVDRFHLVRANQLEPEQLAKAEFPEFQKTSWSGPREVVAVMPDDPGRQGELLMAAMSGLDLQFFPETYSPYDREYYRVLERARPARELIERYPEYEQKITASLSAADLQPGQARFVPLAIQNVFYTALVDGTTAEVIGVIPLDPW